MMNCTLRIYKSIEQDRRRKKGKEKAERFMKNQRETPISATAVTAVKFTVAKGTGLQC